MAELIKESFTREQLHAIKVALTDGRPYADRISLGFAARLLELQRGLREQAIVLDELDCLEGLRHNTQTKSAEQFRRPPLYPLWHKHFSAPRHVVKNIGIRWSLTGEKQDALDAMIREVGAAHGDDPDAWPEVLLHRLMLEGYSERAHARRLTSDWMIFGKHDGLNYYLDLATHKEAADAERLLQKLRNGSAAEFPFLFNRSGEGAL